jgi:hypothetical protein
MLAIAWQSIQSTAKHKFEEIILPQFFKQGKYTSFQRQLNIYGFKRITRGADQGAYYHELFLHGRKYLSYGIERVSAKGNGARMASNPATEPDFHKMMPVSYYSKDQSGSILTTSTSTVQGNCSRMASNPASEHDFPNIMPLSYHSNGYEMSSTPLTTLASTSDGDFAPSRSISDGFATSSDNLTISSIVEDTDGLSMLHYGLSMLHTSH